MFSSTLVRRVVVPTAVIAGVFIATTTASADTLGDASPVADAVTAEGAPSPIDPSSSIPPMQADPAADPAAVDPGEPKARMLTFTMKSPQTLDMRGVEPSLYKGKYYRASTEKKRLCVAKRESEGHYDVVSHNGYYGAYQMSPALAKGATWMMLPEHKKLLGDDVAKRVLEKLRHTPLNKWPRYWQDAAFSTIYNYEHTGSGASHWKGGRWHC